MIAYFLSNINLICKHLYTNKYDERMTEAISTRVPKELEEGVEEFMRAEKLEKSAAVRKLLRTGLGEWRQRRALELLERGEITFTKAAEIAGLDVWSFADLVRRSGVVWIKSVEGIKADIKAAME